jgi:hypothetical protein
MTELLRKRELQHNLEKQANNRNCVEFTERFKSYLITQPEKSGFLTQYGVVNKMFPNSYYLSKYHYVDCVEFKEFMSAINGHHTNRMLIKAPSNVESVNYLRVNIDLQHNLVKYNLERSRGYDGGGC